MKIRFLPLFLIVLVLSVVPSEARRHRLRGRAASPTTNTYSGGGLARERGLSQGEATAAGVVLGEISSARAKTGEASVQLSRRYSPDYYRVYAQRTPMTGTTQRVAAAPKSTTVPVKLPPPAPARQPIKPMRVVLAPKPVPTKSLVVAPPTPAPAKPAPVAVRRVAVAPAPVAKPTPAVTSVALKPPAVAPRRVLMLPPGTIGRTIVVPATVTPPAPLAPRRVAVLPPAAKPRKAAEPTTVNAAQPGIRAPIRTVFPEPNRR